MKNRFRNKKNKGFTLVELSIVLVIIGLIIGGVLVGQDLIVAAQIRSTIGQMEKYNTSVNAFRGKYSKIPGDLNNAVSFWPAVGATVNGDGNGLLTDTNGAATIAALTGEILHFWTQLTLAGMADSSYVPVIVAPGLGTSFPQTKFERNGVSVYGINGINYYQLGLASSTAAGVVTFSDVTLLPADAWNIDKKIDDGAATTGNVRAVGSAAPNGAPAANCVDAADASGYNLDYLVAAICQLRVRMNY